MPVSFCLLSLSFRSSTLRQSSSESELLSSSASSSSRLASFSGPGGAGEEPGAAGERGTSPLPSDCRGKGEGFRGDGWGIYETGEVGNEPVTDDDGFASSWEEAISDLMRGNRWLEVLRWLLNKPVSRTYETFHFISAS